MAEKKVKMMRDRIIANRDSMFVRKDGKKTKFLVTIPELPDTEAQLIPGQVSEELKEIFDKREIKYNPTKLKKDVLIKDIFGKGIVCSWHDDTEKEIDIDYGGDTVDEFVKLERGVVQQLYDREIPFRMSPCSIRFCGINGVKRPVEDRLESILRQRKLYMRPTK